MTLPMDLMWENKISLIDAGNLIIANDIEQTQKRAEEVVHRLASTGATIISLGGGHDFAAPSFLGFGKARRARSSKETLGLTNVDPHLDVRELENGKPHSGTPFRQILDSGLIKGQQFLEFGARASRNSRSYFEFCQKKKVRVTTLEEILDKNAKPYLQFEKQLKTIASGCQTMACTFDMDACSDAEGTSAAPVLGFSAWDMCKMAEAAGRLSKVKHFEIAEVAPVLDPAERSSRIAAEMIYAFLRAKSEHSISRRPTKR
jgi:formimidoylglutamase